MHLACPNGARLAKQLAARLVRWLPVILALLAPLTSAGQEPPPTSEGVVIRPSGALRKELSVAESRSELLKDLEVFQARQDVTSRELELRRKQLKGTPGWAITSNLLAIVLEGDLAEALTPLGGHIEAHRNSLKLDLGRKLERLARTKQTMLAISAQIDRQADQLVAKRDELGEELSENQITDRKRLLHQLLLRRGDHERYAQQYIGTIEFYKRELRDLVTLEQQLDGLSTQKTEYVQRLTDAIEHEQDALVTEDVRQSQDALRRFAIVIRDRPAAAGNDVMTSDPPAAEGLLDKDTLDPNARLLPVLETPLSEDAERMVSEELKKAAARAAPAEAAAPQ